MVLNAKNKLWITFSIMVLFLGVATHSRATTLDPSGIYDTPWGNYTIGVTAPGIDTGQGLNELYDMDQNVLQASAVTFTTVNTGQGANELYDMDQNVLTTSNVTFLSVNITGKMEFGTQFNVTGQINTNWEWNGDVVLLKAHWNTSLSQGKLVYLGTNGTMRNTDADGSDTVPCIGITLEAITAGNYGLVLMRGWVYNSAWTLNEGKDVYVSTNAGDATPTIPSGSGDQVQVIGIGISEDLLYFNPDYTILEIV